MFCPVCQDEFRAGFTRCEDCDADLVESLDAPAQAAAGGAAGAAPAPPGAMPGSDRQAAPDLAFVELADYCGFFTIEEARDARDKVRAVGIPCEIAVREKPGGYLDKPIDEEFWLRVESDAFRAVTDILPIPEQDGAPELDDEPGGHDPFR